MNRSCPSCKNFEVFGSIDDILEHMLENNECKKKVHACPHCESNFINITSLSKHLNQSSQCRFKHNMCNQMSDLVGTTLSNNARIQSITTQEIAPSSIYRHEPSLTYNIMHAEVTNSRLTPSAVKNTLDTHRPLPVNDNEMLDDNEEIDQDDYNFPRGGVDFVGQEHVVLLEEEEGFDYDNHFDASSDEEPDEVPVYFNDHVDDREEPNNDNNLEHQPTVVIMEMSRKLRESRNELGFMLQTRKQQLLDLYLVTIGKGTSLTTFDETLKWSNRHFNNIYTGINRESFLRDMKLLAYGSEISKAYEPKSREVLLSTGRKTVLTLFNLNAIITDLLCNSDLMKKENLIFDYNVAFSDCSQHESNVYGEVNTGKWWCDTQNDICAGMINGKRKVLWPLILFIDGVCHGEFTKLSQEPVLVTFSAFKREIRNRPEAWRPLAFLDYKGNMAGDVGGKQSLQEYSDVLKEVFKDLAILQKNGFEWNFEFEHPNDSNVILMIPIQFIIGDCEGHDKLVGRYKSHGNTKCLVRDCFVLTEDGDDPLHVCT